MVEPGKNRHLVIDVEKCCGCFACAAACPHQSIRFRDESSERIFSAPRLCSADCDACQKVCPVNAVALVPVPSVEASHAESAVLWSIPLARCRKCGHPYTTEKIRHLLAQKLSMEINIPDVPPAWISMCPACRREDEAYRLRAASRTLSGSVG